MEGLLNETRKIKKKLAQQRKSQKVKVEANIYAELVLEGKVNAAVRLLNDDTSSGVLPLSADVIKALRQKHPDAKPSNDNMMFHVLSSM